MKLIAATGTTAMPARHGRLLRAALLAGAVLFAGAGPAAEPASPQSMRHYQLLEQALARYQELAAAQPALTALPPLPRRSLRTGEDYAGVPALRVLLTALGDLPAGAALAAPATTAPGERDLPSVQLFDETLAAALQRFQERHGLEQDGVLGPATWRALTTPLSARVRQIEWTLSRWRSLPPNPHARAIFINIPRFRLYAMDSVDDREAQMLQIDVIVGKAVEDLRTPTFSADMTHLIFRPYWDVPRSIALRELLPAARGNPGYLARNNYELVDGSGRVVADPSGRLDELAAGALRVRQRPGDTNALGAVKFMLPNPHNVYLHDTPARSLFERRTRAFSHGCIRVADPAALAEWVLRDVPGWSRERITEAMQGGQPLTVNLPEPIRVYIAYGTAIAREDGSVLFLDDLYGLEKN